MQLFANFEVWLRRFARKLSGLIFGDFYHCMTISFVRKAAKKGGGGVTVSVMEKTCPEEHPEPEKIRLQFLSDYAILSVSPKILHLDLSSKMLSAKYCLCGSTGEVP